MSRLASLTPSRSRVSPSSSPAPRAPNTPPATSPSTSTARPETTHHRMLTLLVKELRNLFKTWDEIVSVDGLKAGKACVDEGTEMDNILHGEQVQERPGVVDHLEKWYKARIAMETVLSKLDRSLGKFSVLVDQSEKIFFEAYRLQGWDFVLKEPLWFSWTLEHFVNTLPPLLTVSCTHFTILQHLAGILTNPDTTFDDAKIALERWRDLGCGGERWDEVREWEELVELEMTCGGEVEDEESDEVVVKRSKKKGKR